MKTYLNFSQILAKPVVIDNIHESCYRSYHILNMVLTMIERGDSKETIIELAEYLSKVDRELMIVDKNGIGVYENKIERLEV